MAWGLLLGSASHPLPQGHVSPLWYWGPLVVLWYRDGMETLPGHLLGSGLFSVYHEGHLDRPGGGRGSEV